MKNPLIIAAACCALAAAWILNDPGVAQTHPDATQPRPVATPSPQATNAAPGAERSITTETETVLGVRVREDRNCTVALSDNVTASGEMFSAYTCTPSQLAVEHPYVHYTDDTLRELSYADAIAAAQLGKRFIHKDREQAYKLLLRATALDGDARHLAWLADAAYGKYRVNGELQVGNAMRQYELAALSSHFGGDSTMSIYLREALLGSGVSQDRLVQLDRRVDELLRIAGNIQRTVYGEVRHGGRPDA